MKLIKCLLLALLVQTGLATDIPPALPAPVQPNALLMQEPAVFNLWLWVQNTLVADTDLRAVITEQRAYITSLESGNNIPVEWVERARFKWVDTGLGNQEFLYYIKHTPVSLAEYDEATPFPPDPGPVAPESPDLNYLPITIEAESATAYKDTNGPDTDALDFSNGGTAIGWNSPGEWQSYTVNLPVGGLWVILAYYANPQAGGKITIDTNGNVTGDLDVPQTVNFSTFSPIKIVSTLPSGTNTIRFNNTGAAPNGSTGDFDKFELIKVQEL